MAKPPSLVPPSSVEHTTCNEPFLRQMGQRYPSGCPLIWSAQVEQQARWPHGTKATSRGHSMHTTHADESSSSREGVCPVTGCAGWAAGVAYIVGYTPAGLLPTVPATPAPLGVRGPAPRCCAGSGGALGTYTVPGSSSALWRLLPASSTAN